jgi:hypothetical protein
MGRFYHIGTLLEELDQQAETDIQIGAGRCGGLFSKTVRYQEIVKSPDSASHLTERTGNSLSRDN